MPKRLHHSTRTYRLHKPTGQAVVTLSGRDCYLGKHNTPTSREAYDRLIAEWLTHGRRTPAAHAETRTVIFLLSLTSTTYIASTSAPR